MKALFHASVVFVFLGSAALLWTFGKGALRTSLIPDAAQQQRYRELCEPIFVWIDGQRARTGRFPAVLRPDHLANVRSLDPLSRYRVYARGEDFMLCIGDYEEFHQWVYYYSSSTNDWHLDG